MRREATRDLTTEMRALAEAARDAARRLGHAPTAVKDAALGMMSRAAELDQRLDAAAPLRALGAWRAALPIAAVPGV